MKVRMKIRRIIISETDDRQVVVLKEAEGERVFPIIIGSFEAVALDRRIKGHMFPRPMTHDLIDNTIKKLGGELRELVIHSVIDYIFFANLVLRLNGKTIEVDCRPSDGMTVCARDDIPIFVEDDVLDRVIEPSGA